MKYGLLLVVAVIGCEPAPCEHKWGYYCTEPLAFHYKQRGETPKGIAYDSAVPLSALDKMVDDVESCLETPIDRSSFVVKVPDDWSMSCDGTNEVLPVVTYAAGCLAKGQEPTTECPCRYRAVIQCPNIIVATPNLLLFKDALVRFKTGVTNPWIDPALAQCASP